MNKYILSFTFFVICISVVFVAKNTIEANQGLLKKKCGMCHVIPKPNKYSKSRWIHEVNRMAKRAGLTSKEKNILIKMYPGKK